MNIQGVTLQGITVIDAQPVTSGLKQYYDIGDAASYPGSGSTVTDLSASGFGTGSLVNSPTYTSAGQASYLTFNGTNNYFLTPNLYTMVQSTLNVTLEVWVRTAADNGIVVDEQGNLPVNSGWHDGQIVIVSGTLEGAVWPYTTTVTGSAVTRNAWQQYALTFNDATNTQTLYLNGASVGSSSIQRDFSPVSGGLWYAVALGDITSLGDTSYLACDWSVFKVYNRALTAAEVLQNFNALRGRYGV